MFIIINIIEIEYKQLNKHYFENIIFKLITIENNSDTIRNNLGVMYETWWWRGAERFEKLIYHFNEGIKYFNMLELQIRDPNRSHEFKEGWYAIKYPDGYVGHLYDLPKMEKINMNILEEKIPDLKPGKTTNTSTSWIVFADTWQEIRQIWKEIYENPSKTNLDLQSKVGDTKTIGLFKDTEKGILSKGLILDKSQDTVSVIVDTFREAEFNGNLVLRIRDLEITPDVAKVDKIKQQKWIEEFKIVQGQNRLYSGLLVHDTLSRIYKYPVAIGYFDKTKEVLVQTVTDDKGRYLEVDNGFLKYKGSSDFRGHVFHLSVEGSDNYLLSFFPKAQPYLWWNEFYGGIGFTVAEAGKDVHEKFSKLKYVSSEIEDGLWKGIEFKSEIFDFAPSLKGLQATNRYFTLPDSAFILYQLIIENRSDTTRSFRIRDGINLKTSGKPEDKYYSEANGQIIEYTINEFDSYVSRQKDLHVTWAAYRNPLQKNILGATVYSTKNPFQIGPYNPNLTFASIGGVSKRNKLEPGEKAVFSILIQATKDLESIAPFAQTNFEDYFKEV